jgi:hypothetical protein
VISTKNGRVTAPPEPKKIELYELAKLRGIPNRLKRARRVLTNEERLEIARMMSALFGHIAYLDQKLQEKKGND